MSHVEISIREACMEDSSAIATILHALDWSERLKRQELKQTQAQIAACIVQCAQGGAHTILVAEKSYAMDDQCLDVSSGADKAAQQVIGYVSVHWYTHLMNGYDGYVSELFIHPQETGHGTGSLLLDAVQSRAIERGCTRLFLINRRIRESYRRGFYTKRGWEELSDAAFFVLRLPFQYPQTGRERTLAPASREGKYTH
jgi:GNAT superfamily N-acetyltransferase